MVVCERPRILYFTSYPHHTFQIECVYNMFHGLTKVPLKSYMNALLRRESTQCKYASYELKQMLNIRKHLPLIINQQTILFPIQTKRASIQHFINGLEIIGLKQERFATRLIFKNGVHLVVNAHYSFVHRKWLECIFLHFMTFHDVD